MINFIPDDPIKLKVKDPHEEMLKMFKLFDDEGSGKITFLNIKRAAQELNENMSDEEITEMINEADRGG